MATEAVARKPDVVRAAVPPLSAAIVVLAAITDPGGWREVALLVVAGVVLMVWARWPRLQTLALTAGVLAPVVLAQLAGQLEPAMFLVSLLALAVAGWEDSTPVAVAAGVAAAVASPVLLAALQPPDERIAATIWMVGIAFPWCMGWLVHRQELLTAELEAARQELAERALAEERRRIARDVHDLVGAWAGLDAATGHQRPARAAPRSRRGRRGAGRRRGRGPAQHAGAPPDRRLAPR